MKPLLRGMLLAVSLGATSSLGLALAQAPTSRPQVIVDSGEGRFRVVNGTPEMARHIMLLDTATGQTWVVCDFESGSMGWCRMPKSEVPSTSPSKGK